MFLLYVGFFVYDITIGWRKKERSEAQKKKAATFTDLVVSQHCNGERVADKAESAQSNDDVDVDDDTPSHIDVRRGWRQCRLGSVVGRIPGAHVAGRVEQPTAARALGVVPLPDDDVRPVLDMCRQRGHRWAAAAAADAQRDRDVATFRFRVFTLRETVDQRSIDECQWGNV